jgi:phosphoenolpyruvate carboxykinase (GTP)
MLPFCGYNMAEYWNHWVEMGQRFAGAPRIFQVNWFRKDADGKYIWPGYGENSRVLAWIIDRLEGNADAIESPIGYLPHLGDLSLEGLDVSADAMEQLFAVDPQTWLAECDLTDEYFGQFGDSVPSEVRGELASLRQRLMA